MYKPIAIDDETKQHISAVLRYYRSKLKIKQSEFIRYRGASVCSADTYSRIENGRLIKRNSIYSYLLYQINASYELFPAFWQQEQAKFNQLTRHLLSYNMEGYEKTCREIQQDLEGSNDYLGREIYELLDISFAFYDKQQPLDDDLCEKYLEIYSIFPESLQDIVKDILFQHMLRYRRDIEGCMNLFNVMHVEQPQMPILMIDQCCIHLFEGRYLESYALTLQLEQCFRKEHNVQRMMDVYEVMLMLYRRVQQNMISESFELQFTTLIKDNIDRFHPAKYLHALYILGLLRYYQMQYKEAYSCFLELSGHKEGMHFLPAALFLNIIAEKDPDAGTAMLEPLPKKHGYPDHIAAFYHYFIMRCDNKNAEELESYLVRYVLPYVTPRDSIYWEPLRNELLSLIKKTKHYYIKKKLEEAQ